MKILVDLEASARIQIDLNEEAVVDVMRNYNGDFNEWSKDNYSDWMDFNDFEVEFDGADYSQEEATKLIKNVKDVLGCDDDFNIDRQVSHMTTLRHRACDTPTFDEELEDFKIDVDLVAKAINYTDFKNPKEELNYIYLNGNSISATDTRKMINITNHKYSFEHVLFPPSFIKPLKDGGKCFINQDGQIYLKYKNQWFLGADIQDSYLDGEKFPEVDRILLSENGYKNKTKINFHKFTSNSVTQKYTSKTFPKELITFKLDDKDLYIKEIYYNEIVNLFDDIDDVYLSKDSPVHFIGKNIQVVVMRVLE